MTRLRSLFWRLVLRLRGAKVGRRLVVAGPLDILCRDGASLANLEIGDDVTLTGRTYIRLRKAGRVRLADGVWLGSEVWLVAANQAELAIGRGARIGSYCILNGGHGIRVGEYAWFAGFVYLNSSDHEIARGRLIQDQGYVGAPIAIGRDNWIGGHVAVNKGVSTGEGVVIGAGTVVTRDQPANAVVVGNPGRVLKYRE